MLDQSWRFTPLFSNLKIDHYAQLLTFARLRSALEKNNKYL